MIVKTLAYPRAALVGNPSDGYHGKTIAFLFREYSVEVTLYESPEFEILPAERDHSRFGSLAELATDVRSLGYYGGVRLIKATAKKLYDYFSSRDIALDSRNCTIRYHSTIPVRLGMAGSSAIIAATARALLDFYGVSMAIEVLPEFLLSVESEELAISAGLQDRVAQTYGGLVYMDFAAEHFRRRGYGVYEKLDHRLIQNVYVAYRADLSEGSEVFHNDMRGRFEAGDPAITRAVARWSELTSEARSLLGSTAREFSFETENNPEYGAALHKRLAPLINENYDLRRDCLRVSEMNHSMVEAARSSGASAKFTGSGGAIVGTYENEAMFERLRDDLGAIRINVVRPTVVDDGFGA